MKKNEKTQITISKILEAAMAEFGENGYAGGTINGICKTGINKGLLYHNFSGKDELYLACLDRSCGELMHYLRQRDGADTPEGYLSARMDFFNEYPKEAHIFFEALLNPPSHLSEKIQKTLAEFNEMTEEIYRRTLNSLVLRDGLSQEDAVSYFHLMQLMLNGYFSSPAFQSTTLEEKAKMHEMLLPRLLDLMLHGIAKGEN